MKRIVVIAVGVLIVVGAVFFVLPGLFGGESEELSAVEAPSGPVVASSEVSSEAVFEPVRNVTLTVPAGATVTEVLVEPGSVVVEGEVLVRLDAIREEAAVSQAEAGLERAEAALGKLRAGPTQAEIRAAEASVAVVQGRLEQASADPNAVAEASAALQASRADLSRVEAGPAEADLVQAQTNRDKAARAVQQAQAIWDQIFWRTDRVASPEALALEQATSDYQAANARYEQLAGGPEKADLDAARARVVQQQATVARAVAGGSPGVRSAALAEVERAQAQLDQLLAGATQEDIAIAEADVRSARTQLDQARAGLAERSVAAPFAGTVVSIDLTPGEQVTLANGLVRLADLSAWLVRTQDLTELNVGRVAVGNRVTIGVDAIPELELEGTVTRISGFGENRQGDIVYDVWIAPDEIDARLRWNMTASAVIDVAD